MYNYLASCGLCSTLPKPGDCAYQIYPKRQQSQSIQPHYSSKSNIKNELDELISNSPTNSVVAGDYTFRDLVNDNPKEVCIRKILKSNYCELVQQHEQSGHNFIDRQFPPEQQSIGEVQDLRVRASWKRIPDIVKDPVFVSGHIDPKDVFQGSLGNAYFLSAVSALAEKDYRIKNIFPELRLNRHGVYMARMLHKGILKQIVVDDYIPVNQQGDPLFAKPAARRQIWIMILQKCWAKLHGSYGAIVGGLPDEVLHSISGAPTSFYQLSQVKQRQEQLWLTMLQIYQNGSILCCSTKSEPNVDNFGLIQGHTYTILQLHERPYRMLKLRNPWVNRQWRGRAADSNWQFWSTLSPADRQNLGYDQGKKSNQTFFMLWEDFPIFFQILSICKLKDNANYSFSSQVYSRKRAQLFQFQTGGGSITLSLSQDPQIGKQSKAFSRSILIIGRQQQKVDSINYSYITSSTHSSSCQHCIELQQLPQGKYIVYSKVFWMNKEEQFATVGIYAQSPVHIAEVSQSKHKKFLYQIFLDHARHNPKKQSIGPGEWICNDLLLRQCGYGYLAFHLDDKSTRKLGIEIAENQYTEKRIALKKPYRGKGIIKTSLSAGNELIVLFLIKSQCLPNSVSLPAPKLYNLV